MTAIDIRDSGGNSPRARTLQDLVTAIALADPDLILRMVSEDVLWTPVGKKTVSGAAAVCRALVRHGPASALVINHIVVHGRSGAVDGTTEYRRRHRAFYIVVDFSSVKGPRVGGITSFSTDITRP